MAQQIKFAWVRCQVGEPVHDLAKYIRDRLNLSSIPMAYTYLLHFAYWDRNPEEVAQEMADSIKLTLPPLPEADQLSMEELTSEDDTTE